MRRAFGERPLLTAAERVKKHIDAYRRIPPDKAEQALALLADTAGLADETDWEAIYRESELGACDPRP